MGFTVPAACWGAPQPARNPRSSSAADRLSAIFHEDLHNHDSGRSDVPESMRSAFLHVIRWSGSSCHGLGRADAQLDLTANRNKQVIADVVVDVNAPAGASLKLDAQNPNI